ncbi:MAG: NYN domain-containing protein [Chloroflexota bacterium]
MVDGYNLIGSDLGLHGALEPKRHWLVQRLSLYQKIKQFKVTVVFDGWRTGRGGKVEQQVDGIRVLYSQLNEKADAVIVRLAREKGSGAVVVSSDREIRRAIERFDAVAIAASEFSKILRSLDFGQSGDDFGDESCESCIVPKKGNPSRLSKLERRRNEKLKKLKL